MTLSRTGLAITLSLVAVLGSCRKEPDANGAMAPDTPASSASVGTREIVRDGVRLSYAIENVDPKAKDRPLRRGDLARVTFSVTDTASGAPLGGTRPSAWLMARPAEASKSPDDQTSKEVIRKLLAANAGTTAATNLNAHLIVALNSDKTITVLDPTIDFTRTRMRNILVLPAEGTDLAVGPNGDKVFVTMPERGQVAVVDTRNMQLLDAIGCGKRPEQVVVSPRGGTVWALDAVGDRVYVLDGAEGKLAHSVQVADGPKQVVFDAAGRFAFVAHLESGRIHRVDLADQSAREIADLKSPLSSAAWSDAASELFVCASETGDTTYVRGENGTTRPGPALPAGSGPMWPLQEGRWVLAADGFGNRVHAVDTSSNQPPRAFATGSLPSQAAFSNGFAYIYCAGSRDLTLLQVTSLSDPGSIPSVQVPILQKAPSEPASRGPGDLIVLNPDRISSMVAVQSEQLLYHYSEGMNAPMGNYQTYSRTPVAIGILDRSLQPIAEGVYSTVVPVETYGDVDLYVYLEQPVRMFGRFDVRIEPDPATRKQREESKPRAIPVLDNPDATLPVGQEATVDLHLVDPESKQRVAEPGTVRVLVTARFGNDQFRLPAEALGDGGYRVKLTLPRTGTWLMTVQCPEHNLAHNTHRALELKVTDDVEGTVQPAPTTQPSTPGKGQ